MAVLATDAFLSSDTQLILEWRIICWMFKILSS
jgi:hypothetical protein